MVSKMLVLLALMLGSVLITFNIVLCAQEFKMVHKRILNDANAFMINIANQQR